MERLGQEEVLDRETEMIFNVKKKKNNNNNMGRYLPKSITGCLSLCVCVSLRAVRTAGCRGRYIAIEHRVDVPQTFTRALESRRASRSGMRRKTSVNDSTSTPPILCCYPAAAILCCR